MCFTRNKSVIIAIVVALVAVSTVFIVMNDREDSSAATYNVNTAADLVDRVTNASNGDVINITSNGSTPTVIELDDILTITQPITLTTDCGAIIRPSSSFTENVLIHVNGFNEDNTPPEEQKKGKLTLGLDPDTTDPNQMLTLDGDGRCIVIYAQMRQSINGTTLTINTGTITNGFYVNGGGGVYVTNAATFVMNGGSITDNHMDPNHPSSSTDYIYGEDVWIGSGAQATINGGDIGKMFVRAWYSSGNFYGGRVTLDGGNVDCIYLDHCYKNGSAQHVGSQLQFDSGTVNHLMVGTSKNVYNNPATFRHAEEPNPQPGGTYTGGSHVAMVNGYGYTTLEDAINAANDGETVTIIGDVDLSSLINVTKDITLEVGEYYTGTSSSAPYVLLANNNLKFAVTIDLDGGSMSLPDGWTDNAGIYTKNFDYGTLLANIASAISNVPTKEGYTFSSWSYTNNGAVGTDAPVITATYTVNQYTATFDLRGGTVASVPDGWTFDGSVYTKDFDYGTPVTDIVSDFGSYFREGYSEAPAQAVTPGSPTLGTSGVSIVVGWIINQYTATFNLNGGTPDSTPSGWTLNAGVYTKDFDYGTSKDVIINDFGSYSRYLYTRGTETVSTDTMGTSGMTITAYWHPWSDVQIFGFNSGVNVWVEYNGTQLPDHGQSTVKTGYTFLGYFTSSNGSTKVAGPDGKYVSGDVAGYVTNGRWTAGETAELTAIWEPKTYNITLDKGTIGDTSGSAKVVYDSTALTDVTLATKYGYEKYGYYTGQGGTGTKVLDWNGSFAGNNVSGYIENGKWIRDEDNIILYGYWNSLPFFYFVDLRGNGGTNTNSDITYGSTNLIINSPSVRDGYALLGYFTETTGGTKVFNPDGSFADDNILDLVIDGKWSKENGGTYYAQWIPLYTMTYDMHGHGVAPADQTKREDEFFDKPNQDDVAGWKFEGWYTSDSYDVLFDFTAHPSADVTIHAKWSLKTYKIVLDKTKGNADGSASVTLGSTSPFDVTLVTRTGYTSIGYFTEDGIKVLNPDGTFAAANVDGFITDGKWSKAEDCKLYTLWEANTYDIHLHHGGDGHGHGSASVTFDALFADIISHAVKDGHKLIGYFTHESGGTMVLNADGTFASHNVDEHITDGKWSKDSHHTLFAQWESEAVSEISDTISNDIEYLKDHYLGYAVIITAAEALMIAGVAMFIRRR